MKKVIILNVIIVLALIITGVYYISIYDDVSENLIRLHVISNSNSEEDTEIKLKVRDNILDAVEEKITKNSTKQDIINALPEMEESANKFLDENNIGYDAKIKFENTEIPRKEYNGIVLPKGNYKSIRVMLGEGGGENWWCVAYPPLCFTEQTTGKISESGEKILRESMDYKSYRMITSDIKYELKIVEVAEKIIDIIKKFS